MDILQADNIVKQYTGHLALDNVTIHVPQGSIYGLLGPNGAGKTTLIRIINHITAPDSGTVTFMGKPLTADSVANIGYLPEERGLYKKMRVGQQCVFFAQLKGMSQRDAEKALKEWFERLEITDWWNKKVEELSKGMAQKVQFIITVLHRPQLLIFDEPFSGFDPINANLLKREILRLRDEGATVIFSTHNMNSVEELCDRITLINKSHDILSGAVDDLRRQYGQGNLRLSYDGDTAALHAALAPMASALKDDDLTAHKDGSQHALIVNLADGAQQRDLIAAANNAVTLRSLQPLMPSMDDIFIRAVSQQE